MTQVWTTRLQSVKERRPALPTLLFLILLAFACVTRVWRLTDIPASLWADEAWFSARAQDVVRGINLIPTVTYRGVGVGDAPLQAYLAAALQALGVAAPFSSRIATSILGVLTIAILYPTFIDLLQEEHGENTARWLALMATTVVAGLFIHLHHSRVGMQCMTGLIMAIPTLWLSWKAFQPSHIGWAIAAGLSLGLSQYAYETSRALPLVIGAWGLLRMGQTRGTRWKHILARLGVIAGFSILAFLPMAIFYVRHPQAYYVHMANVSQGVLSGTVPEIAIKVLRNYGRVLWGISVRGDRMMGRNLAGRPMIYPFLSIFFWLGVVLAVLRTRRSAASRFFLLWGSIMVLPSVLTDEAPAFNRMLAATPALGVFVAWGMLWVWRRASRTARQADGPNRRFVRGAVAALLGVGLALAPILSAYDYFVRWANDPRLFDVLGMGPPRMANRALQLVRNGRVYLTPGSNLYVKHVYYTMLDGSDVEVVDGDVCLPLVDRPAQPVTYGVATVLDHESLPLLKSVYPGGEEIDYVMHPDGYAYAVFFQVPPGTPGPDPQYPASTVFDHGPTLIGYDLPDTTVHAGGTVRLVLYWRASADQAEQLVSFVHVGKGRQSDPMVAQHDGPLCGAAYPTQRWTEGEIIIDTHILNLTQDAPEDSYDIAVGLYRASDVIRLPIERSEHPLQDNRVFLGSLSVTR